MSRSMSRSPSPMEQSRSVTPEPEVEAGSKRKRSHDSPSVSPPTRKSRVVSPPLPAIVIPRLPDPDPIRRKERERQMALDIANAELNGNGTALAKLKVDPKEEMKKMANTKGGGAYIPPHRLRAMMAEAESQDKEGSEYQRLSWEALRKSINGLINKVNTANIKLLVPELFGENLIRGKGLFVRSIMRAQASSLPFTPIFASLVAIVNTKLPQVGELLVTRLILQFRRSFKRNDKPTMLATTAFIAQLVNQQVVFELLAFQILVLLLERPTDDSVEIAVSFMRQVGAYLGENEPKANNGIFERFRAILHESYIDKRVQYMVEVLFQVRKDKYKDDPIIPDGLDLVIEDEAITHKITLDDEDLKAQEMLNVFKFDPEYVDNEAAYQELKTEILGEDSEEEESGDEGDSDEDSDEEPDDGINADGTVDVHDQTGTNVVNLRRTIYLTIMSALDFEEAVHKLLKIAIGDGQEGEMCNMIIECCSQERSYSKFYGLMGERFCKLNRVWASAYEECFNTYYNTIHRYETNRLRNIARFFGHLLAQDAIPWSVLYTVKMNEDDTTSSSRIFIKIMFQEITEGMGLKRMKERFEDQALKIHLTNIFPLDNPKDTRFSINFFTSIGLGAVTEEMREHLKRAPAIAMAAQQRQLQTGDDSSSDTDSSSELSSSESDSDLSSSNSDSRSPSYSSRSRSRTPPPRRSRGRSYRRSVSRSVSKSPAPRHRRDGSPSISKPHSSATTRGVRRSSVSRSRSRSVSYSRSPSPPRRRRRSPSPPSSSRRRRSPSPPSAATASGKDFVHPDRRAAVDNSNGSAGGYRGNRGGGHSNGTGRGAYEGSGGGRNYGGRGGGRGDFNQARDSGYGNRQRA